MTRRNRWHASRAAIGELLPRPVLSAVRLEWGIWCGLVKGVLRRPDIPVGATAVTHHRALAPVRWIGVTVLVVEIAVVHTVVPSGVIRWVLLIVGLYSLIWILGYLLGSGTVRAHLVSAQGLVLRCGLNTDITVPVDVIEHARLARHARADTATIQVDGDVLSLVDNGGTQPGHPTHGPVARPATPRPVSPRHGNAGVRSTTPPPCWIAYEGPRPRHRSLAPGDRGRTRQAGVAEGMSTQMVTMSPTDDGGRRRGDRPVAAGAAVEVDQRLLDRVVDHRRHLLTQAEPAELDARVGGPDAVQLQRAAAV